MKKIYYACCLYSFFLYSTDLFSSQFADIQNHVIVSSVRENGATIDNTRTLLKSVGLVSKQSYEQVNNKFLLRSIIRLLAQLYNKPEGEIAVQLRTIGAQVYKRINIELLTFIPNNFEKNYLLRVADLLDKGASPDFGSSKFGITPLMKAVQLNDKELVDLFLKQGADVHGYSIGYQPKRVRNFSFIYNEKELKKVVYSIISHMSLADKHNALYEDNQINECTVVKITESKRLLNALYIDTMLEARGAQYQGSYPLCSMLINKKRPITASRIKRALQIMLDTLDLQIAQCIPQCVRELLFTQ